MSHFDEQNTQSYNWDDGGVYVIQPTDYVEGGEDGVSNRQAKELTKRTRNLHTRMSVAEGEIDSLQEQLPISTEATLRSAKEYTDGEIAGVQNEMEVADATTLRTAKDYADMIVAALVDNTPEALNTLQELAAALGDNPNFATDVLQAIGERATMAQVNAALAGKADTNHGHNYSPSNHTHDYAPTNHPHYDLVKASDVNAALAEKADAPSTLLINADFNTMTTRGSYVIDGASINNTPIWSANWRLLVIGWQNRCTQVAFPYNSDRMFFRRQNDGLYWSSWVELYHSGNLKIIRGSVGANRLHMPGNVGFTASPSNTTDEVIIHHGLGTAAYSIVTTIVSSNTEWQDNVAAVTHKGILECRVRVTNGANSATEFAPFDFIIMPY